ncbi:pirin family protein [Corallococcus praedator]|uniref:Pirin family protein n=1 Tax=Corallococcus praedator TaxID=2316724 RepID=A0ABX9QBW9_9BACT|nr:MULTISPECIES: pirin family protein [Corallococcus]RKH08177.1 pirin family protein [Corallococcus sp. CA047B]RKH24605.1 pirin family protein [Corallococcus sp. CA031C]RKI00816.1 pirin family protein [Corallococcus praedator]
MLARPLQHPVREILSRTSGHPHGPITRLMSPGDLGELIKPFVFLDLFGFDGRYAPTPMDFGWHPHSGIATVTVMLEGSVRYAETTGKEGILPAGSVEWMRAGGGVWHTGAPELGRVRGFQLWVALPPELENAANASHYVMPKDVPTEGPARVILGAYGGLRSPIAAPPMNYLLVSLKAGERWTYHPPQGHTVAWVAVHEGVLRAPSPIPSGEIAIFEPSERSIDFVAEGATVFVLGSAAKHPHDLVLGNYSVHTSAGALLQGEAEIRRIGHQLRANGTLRR